MSGSSRVFCWFHWPYQRLSWRANVGLVTTEIGEPGGVEVDGVDRRHRVDERAAGVRPGGLGESLERDGAVAHDDAVDVAHDVERRAVDGGVGAQAERRRDRHAGPLQAGDDAVLAAHVVGAGEHVAERRPAQHELGAVRRPATRYVRLECPPAMTSKRNGGVAPTWSASQDVTFSASIPAHVLLGDHGTDGIASPRVAPRSPPRRRARRPSVAWLACRTSMSPMPRSRPRSSRGRSPCPSSSTCGRSGAGRARRSARSSRRSSTPPTARSCS